MNGMCYVVIWTLASEYAAEVLGCLFSLNTVHCAEVLSQQGFRDFKHCKTSHFLEKTLDLAITLVLRGSPVSFCKPPLTLLLFLSQ